MGDFTYRTREEVEDWKTRCPILQLRQRLLEQHLASEAELNKIDGEITSNVAAASAPMPSPTESNRAEWM